MLLIVIIYIQIIINIYLMSFFPLIFLLKVLNLYLYLLLCFYSFRSRYSFYAG